MASTSDRGDNCQPAEGHAWYPVEQCGDIRSPCPARREHRRIAAGCLSITSSLVSLRSRASQRPRHRSRQRTPPAPFLETDEGVDPRWIVLGEGRAGDGYETPAVAKARQGRRMCRRAASAMRRSTFAIAENGGFIRTTLGTILDIEMIVDLCGVEPRYISRGKQMIEQVGAGLSQLVQHHGAAS